MKANAHSSDEARAHPGLRGAAFVPLLALCLLFSLLFSAVASAGEGQDRVRRDVERFVRANLEPGAEEEGRITIEVPALAAFDIDRARYPGRLRTELSTRSARPLRNQVAVTVALLSPPRTRTNFPLLFTSLPDARTQDAGWAFHIWVVPRISLHHNLETPVRR